MKRMDLKNLSTSLLHYSPLVASAIGGPAGTMVASLLSSVFGVTPNELPARIALDPDAEVKIKKFELDNALELAKLSLSSYQTEVEDRKNARTVNTVSDRYPWFVHVFSFLVTLGFFGEILLITLLPRDNTDHDILNAMIGVLGTTFVSVCSYYYGKKQTT